MSKKKQLSTPQEEEFFDPMMFDDENYETDDMINTFGQVADASVEHMKVACDLTKLIVDSHKEKLSTDAILNIFRQSAETILDCTPLKALFDKS